MNICITLSEGEPCPFSEIAVGGFFSYCNTVYVKTGTTAAYAAGWRPEARFQPGDLVKRLSCIGRTPTIYPQEK